MTVVVHIGRSQWPDHVIRHSDEQTERSFGRVGHGSDEFENFHNIAIGSKGNIYTAQVQGQRLQALPLQGWPANK